ncbi:radical SAM protein [Micromonospora sp. BL1]|uniref:4Fe-4S single cluster domain-containing protein n=1 Tax=Micromonospora sp. BL1 TaxID=2478709 RepID=UPI000EF5CF2A|nr:4Fe-4S single cluster domain-containing protein [Micromonospora sp. BL1]RLQ01395.1 radical SAM protein [Micromonospora sp. BL1]
MDAQISRLHHPVSVLGPGRRAGIWFQGCGIRCPGCVSVDTWRPDPGSTVSVAAVLDWLRSLAGSEVDGVTISGGEPTDQPDALAELMRGLAGWRAERPSGLREPDVLVYTGREPDWVRGDGARLLAGADAVVAGPYDAARAGTAALRGSDNQELITLTPLGARRYADADRLPRAAVQVEVSDGAVWMIGIPLPGDLAAVRQAVTDRGVHLRGPSWQT